MDRRTFLSVGAGALAATGSGCGSTLLDPPASTGRLSARPGSTTTTLSPGRHPLKLGTTRDGFIWVPSGLSATRPAPLLVLLHGAGGSSSNWQTAQIIATELGVVLLEPDSRDTSWDLMRGGYGPDVEFVNRALEFTFDRVNVDPARLGLGGFSDGASYALSLGLTNGDFVTDILAFSPGFMQPPSLRGKPKIEITHGISDQILPIDATSRQLVPNLRQGGYEVLYQEFQGGHTMNSSLVRESLGRLVD